MKLYIVIIIVFIGGVYFIYFSNSSSKQTASEKELFPEQSITHGHGLAVDVADSGNLYIATHHGLLVLKDQKDLFRLGGSRDDLMGFTPHPTDPNVFYSSGHPASGGNLGFQVSDDGGYSWTKISNGEKGPVDFHAMTISPVNPSLLYGWYQGNLQRSEDGGKIWKIVNTKLLAVHLTTDTIKENIVYASTPNGQGVQVSSDKGETWQSLSKDLEGGQVSVFAVNPENNKEMFVFSERLGGLAKSLDGGLTWTKSNEKFNGETLLYIAYDRKVPASIYSLTHENAIYNSVDGGEIWKKIR